MELSHKTGEYIVYKKHGIYEIADIRKDKICGIIKTYYILRSVYDSNATVYVPADCEALVSQMEHVLTPEEIDRIIDCSKSCSVEWIETAAERAEYLEEIIRSEDLNKILAMLKLLIQRKEEAARTKQKTFAHDERMLTAAQKIITEAFAFSLGIDKKDVISYVTEKITA